MSVINNCVLEEQLNAALNTILDSKNPEIHHYHRGSHPGARWYIKTILPGPLLLTDATRFLFSTWKCIGEKHRNLVRITETAYDWQGDVLHGWWTIWLDNGIDITWDISAGMDMNHVIIDIDMGLKISATEARNWMDSNLINRQSGDHCISYDRLCEITDFLSTYTSEKRSQENRRNLRILDTDEICSETTASYELDTSWRR